MSTGGLSGQMGNERVLGDAKEGNLLMENQLGLKTEMVVERLVVNAESECMGKPNLLKGVDTCQEVENSPESFVMLLKNNS